MANDPHGLRRGHARDGEPTMTDLKKAAEALEWLGLGCIVGRDGLRLSVSNEERGWCIETNRPDCENAPARDLICDAIEAKGFEVTLNGLPPDHNRPDGRYECDIEKYFMEPWVQGFGKTRTEAVLAAAVAVKEAS